MLAICTLALSLALLSIAGAIDNLQPFLHQLNQILDSINKDTKP